MGRPQNQVRKVEVARIKRPSDDAGENDDTELWKGKITEASGSGTATKNVIVSAQKGGSFISQLTTALNEFSGDVIVSFEVKDSGGSSLRDPFTANSLQGPFSFDPQIYVPEGGSLELTVNNQSAASATLRYAAVGRGTTAEIDQSGSPSSGSGATTFEDFERADPLADYSSTSGLEIITAGALEGSQSLQTTGQTGVSVSSGLANTPSEGDTFQMVAWHEEGTETTSENVYLRFLFGVQDANNFYDIIAKLNTPELWFHRVVGGDRDVIATTSNTGTYESQTPVTFEVDWLSGYQFEFTTYQNDSVVGQLSAEDTNESFTSGQIGFDPSQPAGVSARYDGGKIL